MPFSSQASFRHESGRLVILFVHSPWKNVGYVLGRRVLRHFLNFGLGGWGRATRAPSETPPETLAETEPGSSGLKHEKIVLHYVVQ